MGLITFPENFLFGTAVSAAQVEGAAFEDNRGPSIWDDFAQEKGKIIDGSTPDIACDMYHRYKEDIQLMKSLNIQSFRFSFSWSRIFPEGTGSINQKGLDYYKYLLEELNKNEITPNATLYHWDLPSALEKKGGWLNRDAADWFAEYAHTLYKHFGKDIPLWTTLNEPIATYVGYANGNFAPGLTGELNGRTANHHLLLAHGKAVQAFRQENLPNSDIGIVIDIWHHHPLRKNNPSDIELANLENEKSYRSYLDPIFKGDYSPKLKQWMEETHSFPSIKNGDMALIKQPLDFFGLNCYNRVVDSSDPNLLLRSSNETNVGGNFLDNGSEFYPKAVYDALHILKDDYQLAIPIYITENGTFNCQEELTPEKTVHDIGRIQYVSGFLSWIHKAIQEGFDIRGYYLWSLLDNWEWSAGYSYRFGIVHTDFDSQKRYIKDSGYWYQKCIKQRGFDDDKNI